MKKMNFGSERAERYILQRGLAVLSAIILLTGSLWFASTMDPGLLPVVRTLERPCLVIDPGHGGIDGGAVAYNGVKESELNLSIALKLRDLAAFAGCACVMTREDDTTRSDGPNYSEHEDLVRRTETVNGVQNGVLISIHQNCFPTSQPSGAQVMYASGEDSRRLGESVQTCILSTLEPENRRVAGPAPKNLYLTAHASCPAVLVECGFLSNFSDLQRLCDDRYQSSFAMVLLSAFLQYSSAPTI